MISKIPAVLLGIMMVKYDMLFTSCVFTRLGTLCRNRIFKRRTV